MRKGLFNFAVWFFSVSSLFSFYFVCWCALCFLCIELPVGISFLLIKKKKKGKVCLMSFMHALIYV